MTTEDLRSFVSSTTELFETMLSCSLKIGTPEPAESRGDRHDLIGTIGLSGTAQAAVALRLPEKTALAMVSRFVGAECKEIDAGVTDAVGELVNIIAGGAKAKMAGHKLVLSLPSVFHGDLYTATNPNNPQWIEMPFTSELGKFSLFVAIKFSPMTSKEIVHESVSRR